MCLYSQWQGNKNCARSLFMIWHGLVYIYILHSWIKEYYVLDFRKRIYKSFYINNLRIKR